ncbi:MAG: hypothetical protein AAF206_05980 [Bacteroidota bacterium]
MKKTLFILTGIFFLFSCGKNEIEPTLVPAYLTEMIPYTDDMEFVFASDKGDTVYVGIEISSKIEDISLCAGCEVSFREEVIEYTLIDQDNATYPRFANLELIERAENQIFFSVFSPLDNNEIGYGFDIYTQSQTSEYACSNLQECLNFIEVNGKMYTDVVRIRTAPIQASQNEIDNVVYSKEIGLLQLTYQDGTTYGLLKE